MRLGYINLILIIKILLVSKSALSQNWDKMEDSAYYKIVNNRFNKNNILIGSSANFDINHGDYTITKFGIKPQAGVFLAKKWLLIGNMVLQGSFARQDSGVGKSDYIIALAGPTIRYYLKPKARALFGQVSLFGGMEKQNSQNSEYYEFTGSIYGGVAAFGLSAFFRRFELEILLGMKYSYYSYQKSFVPQESFQINISYIFQK